MEIPQNTQVQTGKCYSYESLHLFNYNISSIRGTSLPMQGYRPGTCSLESGAEADVFLDLATCGLTWVITSFTISSNFRSDFVRATTGESQAMPIPQEGRWMQRTSKTMGLMGLR